MKIGKTGMSRFFAGLCMIAALFTATPSYAEVVSDWNKAALAAIKANMGSPMRDAVVLATLHAAVFEAVNSIEGDYRVYRTLEPSAKGASAEAAAAAAAHRVLVSLFPSQVSSLDEALTMSLSSVPDGEAKALGIAAGEIVADDVIAWRSTDASVGMAPYTPGDEAGEWRPTPPDFMTAMFPGWSMLPPFVVAEGSAFRVAPPPAMTSSEYVLEFLRTKTLGSKNSALRSAEEKETATFWMENPVGRWNMIAQQAAAQRELPVEESARLFALLNFAMNDAQIAAWDTKYFYNRWRPVTAIREADTDGNSLTDIDPDWEPLLPTTPAHPEYVSGHSTVSGAAAEVLASFFGTDDMTFTVYPSSSSGMMMKAMTAPMPQQPRSFDSFSEAVNEIGISRIYGGIHFDSSNATGKLLGRTIGKYVWANVLTVNNAPAEPAIVSPAEGATGVAYAPAEFSWTRCADPDSSDAVSYVIEYSSDPSLNDWTSVEVPYEPEGDGAAGLGLASAAMFGTIVFSGKKGSKILMALLMTISIGFSFILFPSCGGGDPTLEENAQTMELSVNLEPDTAYTWRVTAVDSNGKRSTSATSGFTTGSPSLFE